MVLAYSGIELSMDAIFKASRNKENFTGIERRTG